MTNEEIARLVRLRLSHRQKKDFAGADEIRRQLLYAGVELRDLNNQERMATAWSLGYENGGVIVMNAEDEGQTETDLPEWFIPFPKGYEEPSDDLYVWYQRWIGKKGIITQYGRYNGQRLKENKDALISDAERMWFLLMTNMSLKEVLLTTRDSRISA